MGKVILFNMKEHGSKLAPRVLGRDIKTEAIESLSADSEITLLFDFSGIESMSTGFAKELFGELRRDLSEEFSDRIKFRFGQNRKLLASTIARGLKASSH